MDKELFSSRYRLSYVADPPRGFASYLEKVMKRQWYGDRNVIKLQANRTRIRLFRVRNMDSFGVLVRIRVYVKPFYSAANP